MVAPLPDPLLPVVNDRVRVAVVIPCYKVREHILQVIEAIGPEVDAIFVVDDACPQQSGRLVEQEAVPRDKRVKVLFKPRNEGVGGAVMSGYRAAQEAGFDIMVKVDGDGQMDPRLVPAFIAPILAGEADYTKGNRFFDLANIRRMPKVRILGNAALSLLSKLSTGYWQIFDPTNGFTAIHAEAVRRLPLDRISRRYFFETDMLFRLNTIRAAVVDVPMDPVYGNEVSNLRIGAVLPEFLAKHVKNTAKRIFYNYFLRGLSLASMNLAVGLAMLGGGVAFGAYHWAHSSGLGVTTPAGTVALAVLPVLLGIQFLLAFFAFDIAASPTRAIHPALRRRSRSLRSGLRTGRAAAAGRGQARVDAPAGPQPRELGPEHAYAQHALPVVRARVVLREPPDVRRDERVPGTAERGEKP